MHPKKQESSRHDSPFFMQKKGVALDPQPLGICSGDRLSYFIG
jgi:hypothetical protein